MWFLNFFNFSQKLLIRSGWNFTQVFVMIACSEVNMIGWETCIIMHKLAKSCMNYEIFALVIISQKIFNLFLWNFIITIWTISGIYWCKMVSLQFIIIQKLCMINVIFVFLQFFSKTPHQIRLKFYTGLCYDCLKCSKHDRVRDMHNYA